MPRKLVLFDLDGTVLDTELDMFLCVNELFARLDYPPVDLETVRRANGKDAYGYMRTLMGEGVTAEEVARAWEDYCALTAIKGADNTKVFEGVEAVLEALSQKGYILAALTNKTEEENAVFKEKILCHLPFDAILAVGDTDDAKPAPGAILKCLTRYGIAKENAYLVGDCEPDILSAIAAEINPVAVLWGNRTREQLCAVGAKIFAERPDELTAIIG
ncbi:MAG: HAD family hydrolase [Clostridia bacterium]|nr:HAD family hydrolase [Clostridia bacterium]